ncbi:hypothetical protein LIER_19017 [Lithospermum erythrorhizon]|uniref:Uncharacterized protein n=1 Tax=Lithospermum erythrorhizon TaxID=34254 RepID=A0AAV3QJ35_LITER
MSPVYPKRGYTRAHHHHRDYNSPTSTSPSWSLSRDNRHRSAYKGKAPARSPPGNNRQGATLNMQTEDNPQPRGIGNVGGSTRGPAKHNMLLPFSYLLRHESMTKGFRMLKLGTFDGMGDPTNHIKAYDSQLSFWAREDYVYAIAFPGSLAGPH